MILSLGGPRHQGRPRLTVRGRGRPGARAGVDWEGGGDEESEQPEHGQHPEETQPAPVGQEGPAEGAHQQVVDDVAGEEEAVDRPAVLVSEGLGGNCRLGGVRPGEGEVDGPHGRREGDLAAEGGGGEDRDEEGEADGLEGHGHLVTRLVHQQSVEQTTLAGSNEC